MNLLSSSLVAHPGATLSTLTPDRREKEDVIRVSRQRPVLRACSGLVLGWCGMDNENYQGTNKCPATPSLVGYVADEARNAAIADFDGGERLVEQDMRDRFERMKLTIKHKRMVIHHFVNLRRWMYLMTSSAFARFLVFFQAVRPKSSISESIEEATKAAADVLTLRHITQVSYVHRTDELVPSPEPVVMLSAQDHLGPSQEVDEEFAKELARITTESSAESRKINKTSSVRKKRVEETEKQGQRTAGALVLRFEVLDVRRRPRHLPVPAETALAVLTLGTIVGYSGATMPQVTGAELGTKGGSSSAQGSSASPIPSIFETVYYWPSFGVPRKPRVSTLFDAVSPLTGCPVPLHRAVESKVEKRLQTATNPLVVCSNSRVIGNAGGGLPFLVAGVMAGAFMLVAPESCMRAENEAERRWGHRAYEGGKGALGGAVVSGAG
ncbi:hypothetical protein EDD17DRAFT_1515946 [Pisolithus thermaeus]|nr:hypothetical protein EDD17DRAFT_1515946 [Pisolithus thermaeus]